MRAGRARPASGRRRRLQRLIESGEDYLPWLAALNDEYRRLNLTMGGVADCMALCFALRRVVRRYDGVPCSVPVPDSSSRASCWRSPSRPPSRARDATPRAALPFTVISADARRPLGRRSSASAVMVGLDDLAALFQLAVREDALAGGVTVSYKGETVILTAGQALASAGGRLVSLPGPARARRPAVARAGRVHQPRARSHLRRQARRAEELAARARRRRAGAARRRPPGRRRARRRA